MCNTTTTNGWSFSVEVGSVSIETVDLVPSRVSFAAGYKDFIDLCRKPFKDS